MHGIISTARLAESTVRDSVVWQKRGYDLLNQPNATDLRAARRLCRRLARSHYENFLVASLLIPRRYLQHLYNIYAFCRRADDLADETADPTRALQLLHGWREELRRCYDGTPCSPIMLALQDTIRRLDIPVQPFADLISAFEQDCRVATYQTFDTLVDYCRRSANPVGRLFLWVFGYRDSERLALSDHICTALQLTNFWQDIPSDYQRGRIYIPFEDIEAFSCNERMLASQRATPEFVNLLSFQVERTRKLFESAAELPRMVDRRISVDVELFRRAGLAVLDEIQAVGYDVLSHRPRLSKVKKAGLLISCIVHR